MTTVAMDESGNTHEIIAIALVSIPDKLIPEINKTLSLSGNEPEEIKILYHKKSGGEFKFSDLRNAFRQTQLDVYDKFLRLKLTEISKLKIQAYASVFPNDKDNSERLNRFLHEAEDLLVKWAHQNQIDAYSKDLKTIVDQQIFPETYIFNYYMKRGTNYCSLIPEREIKDGKVRDIRTDRENSTKIEDANSKSYKSIQLTDLLVGCAREKFAMGVEEYFSIVKALFPKEHLRIQLKEYKYSKRGILNPVEFQKW
ncbi:MAG: DUF3800 domain-containing protein [Patescibacteria group bacterium]|mgnify:CR=1 FL=1